jgi:two-component system, LytTR family, sensor kinase
MSTLDVKKIGKIKNTCIHIFVWILVFTINYIFFKNNVVAFDLKYNLIIWLVYVSLFYISYSFLIPFFLFRDKLLAFISSSVILIALAFFTNQVTTRNQFMSTERQREAESGINSFRPFPFAPKPPDFRWFPALPNDSDTIRRHDQFGEMPNRPRPPRGIDFNRIMFPLYGLLLVYFSSIIIKMLIKFKEDERKKEDIMKERVATELLYLKQQINPHFLFNTLNNIYSLSIKNPEITPEAILKISSILRYTLYKTDNSPSLLKDEIEIISTYIDFQRLRSKNELPVTYNVTGIIENYKVESFILIPLVENAFKYGMANIKDSFINIQVTIINDNLEFIVSNKKSLIEESDPEHSGIGLKNIKRRLDLVYADYHEFKITDEVDVFTVNLKLPLINEKKNELHSC